MDNLKINYNIPASIVDFQETENQYLTKAKLEVFYVGETVDKRLFTREFSENLINTLPQMPVVGYYDDDEEDFLGHNGTQYVYGYVPETTHLEFTERDGKTFAVTDVVLFTGRDDNIGDVASKIVGKQQSLEMDPNSVRYKVNRENGKFKNIEFTNGHITGLSVLGDEENPAFTGSQFFKEKLEQSPEHATWFVKFIKEARELLSSEQGGVSMDKFLEKFKLNFDVEAFIKKTYDEERMAVHEALSNNLEHDYFYIVQMNSDTVVYYDYMNGAFFRNNYSDGEEGIEFNEQMEVKARYLTEDEIDTTFTANNVEDEVETEEEETDSVETETEVETDFTEEEIVVEEETIEEIEEEETVNENFEEITTTEEEVTIEEESEFIEADSNNEEELEDVVEEEATEVEENFSQPDDSSSGDLLTSEERDELEEFRRKEKLSILNEYGKYLTEEQITDLTDKMGEHNAPDFEKEVKFVAFEAMQAELNKKEKIEEPIVAFNVGNITKDTPESELDRTYRLMEELS